MSEHEFLGYLLAYAGGAFSALLVWAIVTWRRATKELDRVAAMNTRSERRIRQHERRRDAAMSPLDLYRSSGKEPTGRTADILMEAERGRRRREAEGQR